MNIRTDYVQRPDKNFMIEYIAMRADRDGPRLSILVDQYDQHAPSREDWEARALGFFEAEAGFLGHGHVKPKYNGMKTRCGGPLMCPYCVGEKQWEERGKPVPESDRPKQENPPSGFKQALKRFFT